MFSLTEMQFRANWAGAITSFSGLPKDQKEKFLDYKLDVYICEGDDSEKLEWFKTINIAGKELKAQELRNAIYVSTWLDDAKRYFSRKNCKAKNLYEDYLTGEYDRQDILEKALSSLASLVFSVFCLFIYVSISSFLPTIQLKAFSKCNELGGIEIP